MLIEEKKGVKPKYGFIQYKEGRAFSIPYTKNMKSFLLKTMQKMRDHIESGESPKPIKNYRCEKCSYKKDCFPE